VSLNVISFQGVVAGSLLVQSIQLGLSTVPASRASIQIINIHTIGFMIEMKPDKLVDCLGLYCPEPIFRTRIALDEMEPGETLEVTADDPAAEEDIPRLVNRLGHELLSFESEDGVLRFLIKKK
jgi:tRNA 2-thiouridine synthesizing protein A